MKRDWPARALAGAGHAAVWPGLYGVGALWLASPAAGVRPTLAPAAFVFLTAQACYLFDRVKLSSGRLDPADALAHPARRAALGDHQRAARAYVVIALGVASWIGFRAAGWPVAAPALAAVGVWAYAGRPAGERRRPKDRLAWKAMLTASGHACLAGVGIAMTGRFTAQALPALLMLTALVFADAVACDLDDLAADRAFGTRSLAVELGPSGAWLVTLAGWLAAGLAAAALLPGRTAAVFAGGLLLTGAIAMATPGRKDFIDARLVLIAAACAAVG